MGYTFKELRDLVEQLKKIHRDERSSKIESMLIVGILASRNAAVHFGMTYERFLTYIGLTKNQYWKRAQAAMVCRFHPEALAMLRANEVELSHLALINAKITQANKDFILNGIKLASTREVKLLLARVTKDGRVLDIEPEIEVRLSLTRSQLALLERSREVRSHGGHMPTLAEVVVADAQDALDKRDPLRKAARAAARSNAKDQEQKAEASPDPSTAKAKATAAPSTTKAAKIGTTIRPAVPSAVRHAVYQRDQGRCTWRYPDGTSCDATAMLELDHRRMWCRGGEHSEDNLTLRCRSHNQHAAREQLGAEFMARWTSPTNTDRHATPVQSR